MIYVIMHTRAVHGWYGPLDPVRSARSARPVKEAGLDNHCRKNGRAWAIKTEFGQTSPARYIFIVDLNLYTINNLMIIIKKIKK